ncbi:Fructokinase [hydrothermal vent metagenome]|uniref:Fructokinase n=1 Tax=hydrothermal vent metagenome TaxID=652676 RepID=A0A3B1D3N0_9ZZZZ
MNYDLVGIGNALVDIEVRVEDAFIQKHSLTKGGMQLSTSEEQKLMLDSLQDQSSKIASGGSAANTVHGISVLGSQGYYLGRVANDNYGRHYSEDMKTCQVGFPGPDGETSGTGTCVVLVTPDSERTMLTHLGISSSLHPDNVDATIVQNARMTYIEGYLWTGDETRKAALKMAEIAKTAGIPVAFTLSDAFVVNTFKEGLQDFIRWNVDILFCNEVEALAMADATDIESAFETLGGMADTVFMTLGAKGSWVRSNGKGAKETIGVFPVTPVDTTGAGDLFAAGALHGILNGHSLKESAVLGSYCAAQVVSHMGPRMPVGAHTDANKILDEYAKINA